MENYGMDNELLEISKQRDLVNVAAETQTILQLLVAKEIVTREEVAAMRERVRNSKRFKALYEHINNLERKAKYYKGNPDQYYTDALDVLLGGAFKQS